MSDDSDGPTMSDDGDEHPTGDGCELDGVYYANGEQLPRTDCNSRWCQDGRSAQTLLACAVTLDECEGALAACRMAGTSMTCTSDYDACIGQAPTDSDMCEQAVQACIDAGEDAMACVTRYNCGAQPTVPDDCESALAACRMEGTSMTCAEGYNACIGQMPPSLGACESGVQQCVDSGEDAMRCVTRFNCDGPPTSPDECETIQGECATNGDTLCDELYAACLERTDPPVGSDMCEAAIENCIADGESESACRMRYAGCGSVPATPQDCESAYVYCQTSTMPVACDETYEACMAEAAPLTVAQCQAELESCEADGMSMTCAQGYDICVSYAVE